MPIQPLIQSSLFDVADWQVDSEFAVFPQGARAKEAVFAPKVHADPVIVGDKRYLFKRSKSCYPDQFWGEVIAYRIGCLLGVQVPPAFVAFNSRTGHCAALIEWFYIDGVDTLTMGGDFLQEIFPDFDRKQGTQHNLIHNTWLCDTLFNSKILVTEWIQWWVNALLFDALIGNTDRHQDNWGFIFYYVNNQKKSRLTPLFDNGTSLGHERFPKKVNTWQDIDVTRYVENKKACHHVKWSMEDQPVTQGHFELLERAFKEWPQMQDQVRAKLNFSLADMSHVVNSLSEINAPEPLSRDRINFVLRLLVHRYKRIKSLLL